MRTRNHRFSLWLDEREFNHLTKQSELAGLKKEPFIRKLIMSVDIVPRPPDDISKLLREINAIGNNINQIAKKVNINNTASQDDISETLRLLGEVYREIKR